ncbi:MAG: S9 family peptidase [Bacteroidales bacterium]|nr:S9 family peptidase [Bacteroidales bacterium]
MRINRSILPAALALVMAVPGSLGSLWAQKKPLDHDVYDSWQSVSGVKASDNGSVLVWNVNPQEGDGTLYIRRNAGWADPSADPKARKTKEDAQIAIPRGYQPAICPVGKWVVCRIKPEFAKTRQERIDKKKKDDQAKDSLAVIDIATMTVKKFPRVDSYSTGAFGMPFVAYKSSWKENKKTVNGLILLKQGTWHADTLKGVDNHVFSASGERLALTTKKDKKDSLSATSVILATYPTPGKLVLDTLRNGAEEYFRPVFDDSENLLTFTATTDTNKTGSKRCGLFLANLADGSCSEIIPQGTMVEGTDGWTLTENSSAYFTPDSKRIMTGIAPLRPPKDTTIVDFETAQLDIWNWDAPYTPPMQKKRVDATVRKTYPAVINLTAGKARIIPLTTSFFDSVRPIAAGKTGLALSRDNSDFVRESMWADGSFSDYSLVSLEDGSRKPLFKGFNCSRFDASPEGKYFIWFDSSDRNWYTYDITTGETVNLTGDLGVAFHDEQDDHPTKYPGAYEGSPKWLEGDKAVLIIDRYDVWRFSPDGTKVENLTGGVGRRTHNRFRTADFRPDKRTANERSSGVVKALNEKETLYLTVQNEDDKKNGFGFLNLAKPAKTLRYFTDTVTFQNPQMDPQGKISFLKGNFRNPMDLYTTSDFFATSAKLSAINPQMADYRWGSANLFEWKAYDGTPLKGLVFIPDDIKPGEKLPVMIYFYEKYSDQLYNFWQPAPSRSTVNLSFYTSRGYVVFVPDIVYKDGHPGESAYNCICSGAEALCEKYPFADKSKMAIQGQSWGGYQTAWLVTRTNMFAAAGAGAPVSNMTSAYGGIRWESGMTRAGQYEHGQSRIGKTLWDEGGLDLYLENSPIFHADKVETPLLIMHNDNDGAVPWYQGIEYFSDLRRLGKPCWLLEYNNEAHNLVERRNCKDLSKRLQQFFDHYLKGEPMPAWMKTGVPTDRKGEYFGFEY